MKISDIVQIALVVGLLGLTFGMFFFVVPPANVDLFKMCVVSIISFISGATAGKFMGADKGEGK